MSATSTPKRLPNVLLIGTGEYTTGLVNGQPSNSDKAAGRYFSFTHVCAPARLSQQPPLIACLRLMLGVVCVQVLSL